MIQSLSPCGLTVLSLPWWKLFSSLTPTVTAGVCSSPATLRLRPTLSIDRRHEKERLFRWRSLLWIYVQHSAMFSLPMQLPLSLQNDSANAAVRALCRVHKIQLVLWKDMIVQMSSSPPRGIVMYTELVVGFNCDIYETWESNICAPDSFCGSATQRTLFPKGLNCCINYWWSGWINLSGIVFLSCKLVVPETVVGLNMRRLPLVF